jgi:hypothetical protein
VNGWFSFVNLHPFGWFGFDLRRTLEKPWVGAHGPWTGIQQEKQCPSIRIHGQTLGHHFSIKGDGLRLALSQNMVYFMVYFLVPPQIWGLILS